MRAKQRGRSKINNTDYRQGINSENLPKVFDRFAQINPKKTGTLRSTGLGLAFCKMVGNAHNCEIGLILLLTSSPFLGFTLNKSVTEELIIHLETINFLLKNVIFLTERDENLNVFIFNI